MERASTPSLHLPSQAQQQDVTKQLARSPTAAEVALRSVQKPSPKPWKKPEQSRATKVYNVSPREFRDLVQQLTGASSPSGDVVAAAQRSLTPTPPQTSAALLLHGGSNNNNVGYSGAASPAMHEEMTSKMERRALGRPEPPTGFMDIFSAPSSLPGWWQLQSP